MAEKKNGKFKKFIWIVIIIAISAGLLYANKIISARQSAVEVTVGKAEKGNVEITIQASGNLEPADKVKVRAEVDGNIKEKRVKEGDTVKKGEILLEVDQEKLKKEVLNAEIKLNRLQSNLKNLVENTGPFDLAQVENNLTKSKIALDFADKNLKSTQRIYEQEVVTRRQLEETERAFENAKLDYIVAQQHLENQKEKFKKDVAEAKGEIQLAEADLKEAKDKLNKANITAPIAGSIVEDIIKEKKYVSFGEELFTVGDISKYNAKLKVDELDIGKVKIDQPVTITSDAFKEARLSGHVIEIAAQATRSTFAEIEVTVAIDSTNDQPVRPNLSVDGDIQTEKFENVLRVPVEAVVKQSNKNYVFLLSSNRVKKKEVTVGVSNPKFILIEKGLKEGDSVILEGAMRLKDNDRVKIKKPKEPKA